jgi:Mn-dependent DtxR family transcriptional regulator
MEVRSRTIPLMTQRTFTEKEGQYLSFIFYYTMIHGCAPAEADLQRHFKVSPPTVHQMVLTLEGQGLIEPVAGEALSVRLLIDREDLPEME